MSKITNDGLTRYGTGCFIAYPYGNSRHQGLNYSIKLLEDIFGFELSCQSGTLNDVLN